MSKFQPSSNDNERGTNLLKRVSAFLPKIDEANKKMKESQRIDDNLAPSNDEDSESESPQNDPSKENSAPQIQFQVALGNFEESAIALLEESSQQSFEDKNESKKKCLKKDIESSESGCNGKESFVEKLLSVSETITADVITPQTTKDHSKKTLIQPLD